MKAPVTIYFDTVVTVQKKDGLFISCCPVLRIVSQGDTKKESLRNITDAVQLYVATSFIDGTLEKILTKNGIEPVKKVSSKPLAKKYHEISVPIPFNMPINKGNLATCQA